MIEILKNQTFQEFLAENMGNAHLWSWYNSPRTVGVDDFQPEAVLILQDLDNHFNFPKVKFSGQRYELPHGPYSWFQFFEYETDAVLFSLTLDR